MKEIISDIIMRFLEDYYKSSRKTKTILIICLMSIFIILTVSLFRSCQPSQSSLQKRFGLLPLSKTDDNGNKWMLYLVKGQPLAKFKNSSAKPGPPLSIKTDVQTKGRDVSIGLKVEGKAGEKYIGGATKNGKWEPSPKLKIVDEAGKVLTSGQFEYG